MARPAPGAERMIAVLNWLAAHPERAFTLTELIRGLKLNPATCHALLATLAEAGYVYRDSSKAYRLGPTLAAIGEIARKNFAPIALIRDDMRRLADDLGLICIAAGRVGLEMVILERAVPASQLTTALSLGARFTIQGVAGFSFMTWSSPADTEAWLDGIRRASGEQEAQGWADAIAGGRRLGFCFAGVVRGRRVTPASALEAGDRISLNYLTAPVLDEGGDIIFCLTLHGFDRDYSPDELAGLGARLSALARTAQLRIQGQPA